MKKTVRRFLYILEFILGFFICNIAVEIKQYTILYVILAIILFVIGFIMCYHGVYKSINEKNI